MTNSTASPMTAEALKRFFRGTVVRLFATSARVRFREFDDTYLDYDITHARLFIPSPTAD